jgi:hypothetical protein
MKYFCKTCGIDVESGSNCPIGQEGVLTPCEPIDEPSPFIKLVGIWKGDDLQECMEREKFNEFYNIAIRPLEEENQRLRKALEEIANGFELLETNKLGKIMQGIARQALAGEEKG